MIKQEQITVPQLVGQQFDATEMLKLLPSHSTAILGDDQVSAEVLQASWPELKALIKWGIGTDNIDLESAKLMEFLSIIHLDNFLMKLLI